jgi:predicted O-methyltransferase YrrM
LARAATTYGGNISTIEMLPWKATLAREHFELADVSDSIELIEGTALDVLDQWDRQIDFVFLDADRRNYISYIEKFDRWLPVGAVVIADNALDCEDFKSYQQYMAQHSDFDSALINLDNGLLLSIKK